MGWGYDHEKLEALLAIIKRWDGGVEYYFAVVEFQHRGFPHVHIALRCLTPPQLSGMNSDFWFSPSQDEQVQVDRCMQERVPTPSSVFSAHSDQCQTLLTGVSLPATAPRTAWHLRCEKYSTGRAPHKQITGGELLQNDFKMSVNYM